MGGWERPRCGAISRTGFRRQPAPACSSIRAPAMALQALFRCRARSTTCASKRSRFCQSCWRQSAFAAAFCSDTPTAPRLPQSMPAASRIIAFALIAPHFVVEDISVASIAEIKTAYENTDLRAKLARWHNDVDNAFYGWNGAWLDPKFRNWDISDYLAYIRVPVAVIQGADDQYGTIRQVKIAQEECYCPVDVTIIAGAGHQPHRETPAATLDAISDFANAVLRTHEGFRGRAA